MFSGEDVEQRVLLRFLESYAQDVQQGIERPLTEYLALHPGHEERIRAEFQELTRDAERPSQNTFGPFRLLTLLGEGGQGTVYLAEDPRHGNRRLALKILPRNLTREPGTARLRMRRELEALARLHHPNISVVYEAGTIEDHGYLAMRHVEGRSLAAIMNERCATDDPSRANRLDRDHVRRAITWCHSLAEALQVAHEARIVHRDVKPSNILIDESDRPILIDFGLARAEDSQSVEVTRTGDLIGTPQYMPPERLRGEALQDPRSDVWSLGVVLYELVTGRRPFEGPTLDSIARHIERDEPRNPRHLNGAISRDLSTVIRTALEKSPARRYQSAGDLADDLQAVREGQPIAARPVTRIGQAARWVARHPAVSILLTLLGITSLFAGLAARESSMNAEASRRSLLRAKDYYARSTFEEARLLTRSTRIGRRFLALERIVASARARTEVIQAGHEPVQSPSTPELRGAAFEALQSKDARMVYEVSHSELSMGAVSPDGRFLALRSVREEHDRLAPVAISILDTRTGEEVARTTHPELLHAQDGLAVANDGRTIAIPDGKERHLEVWQLPEERRLARLELPRDLIVEGRQPEHFRTWFLGFCADTRFLGAAVAPRATHRALPSPRGYALWRIDTKELVAHGAGGNHRFPWHAFASDGTSWVVPVSTRDVIGYELGASVRATARIRLDQDIIRAIPRPGSPMRILGLASRPSSGPQTLFQVRQGSDVPDFTHSLNAQLEIRHGATMQLLDDHAVLVADSNRGLHIFDLEGRERVHLRAAHERAIECVHPVQGGQCFVSHARGGQTRCWAIPEQAPVVELEPLPETGEAGALVTTSPDGRRIAFIHPGEPDRIWVWNPGDPSSRIVLQGEDPGTVFEVRFGPENTHLARIGDRVVQLWDLEHGTHERFMAPPGSRYLTGAFAESAVLDVILQSGLRLQRIRLPDGTTKDLAHLPDALWSTIAAPRTGQLIHLANTDSGRVAWLAGDRPELEYLPLATDSARATGNSVIEPSGRWLSALIKDPEPLLHVWDGKTRTLVFAHRMSGRPEWNAWSIHPRAPWIAIATTGGNVTLMHLETGEELVSWHAGDRDLHLVRFLDDGRLVTYAQSRALAFWNLDVLRDELGRHGLDW